MQYRLFEPIIKFGVQTRVQSIALSVSVCLSVYWPDCKPEEPLFSAEFVCELCLSVCMSACR